MSTKGRNPAMDDVRMKCLARAAARERVAIAADGLSAKERKLLTRIEDHLGRVCDWPVAFAEQLLSKHLTYKPRFTLTLFLLANKCSPPLLAEWMLSRGMLHDHSARTHVAGIIKDHQTGKLESDGRTAYVMDATLPNGDTPPVEQRVWPVYTPNFAHDWKFQYIWDEAIVMLKQDSITAVPSYYSKAR